MRIIGGEHKGRKLLVPKGIRPVQNFIKKAIFDILADLKGKRFLDLFAGSGAIGMEAISRGAKEVVFVENNPSCIKKIKKNLALIKVMSGFQIVYSDVNLAIRKFFQEKENFDFVFVDPPYEKNLAKKTLKTLGLYDIVNVSGLIIIKHSKREVLPEKENKLVLFKQRRYADTVLSFYIKNVSEGNLSRNI